MGDLQAAVLAGEPGVITAEVLCATFAGWRVFERGGCWHAIGGGTVAEAGPRSLIRTLVSAPTLKGLAEQLVLQDWLRRMTAAELEAVWRGGPGAAAPVTGLPAVPRVPAVPRPLTPLAALRRDWGDAYRISRDAVRGWRAVRRDETGAPLTAAGPDGLRGKIRDDYGARPVPREAAP